MALMQLILAGLNKISHFYTDAKKNPGMGTENERNRSQHDAHARMQRYEATTQQTPPDQ